MKLRCFFSYFKLESGTDEAGRGCLAGPVTAAAVILPEDFSLPLLNDSKQLSEKIREKLKDDFAKMLNYTALGEYYKVTKQYKTSNDYFLKSNAVAKKINFVDIQKYNYEQITGNYQSLGNYKSAFESLALFNVLNDSLYNVQKLKDIEEIATKYETAEKEKKIAEKEIALKNRNQWIFGLIALAIIVGLLGFILYKQQVLKNIKQQKDNELLLALEKIESQNQLQEQRLTISRDLHDNIGAQLSFIVSAIDTIKYYVSDTNEPVTNKLTSIGTFAKETIQELRDTIWAMNKPTISIKDLKSRIANFMEKAKLSHQNIQILLKTDADITDEHAFTCTHSSPSICSKLKALSTTLTRRLFFRMA